MAATSALSHYLYNEYTIILSIHTFYNLLFQVLLPHYQNFPLFGILVKCELVLVSYEDQLLTNGSQSNKFVDFDYRIKLTVVPKMD